MSAAASREPHSDSATVVTSQNVRQGRDGGQRRRRETVNVAARFGARAGEGSSPSGKRARSVAPAPRPTVSVPNLTAGHDPDEPGVPATVGPFIGDMPKVGVPTRLLMPLVDRALAFRLPPGRAHTVRIHVLDTAPVPCAAGR